MDETPSPRRIRLIALDLDGTLLNDASRVSQEDAAALRHFVEQGGIVTLASGRMTANIRPFYDAIGVDGPTIGYNGALARDSRDRGKEVIFELPLPARYADALIEYTRQEGFHLNYYLHENLYARDEPELRPYADFYSRQTGAVFSFVPDLERFRGHEPTKAIIVTDRTVPGHPTPRGRDELFEVWRQKWGAEVTVMRTNPEYLEFYHVEAGKGRALAELCRHYGIDQSETMAFGDNHNDVTMLEWAGLGVAVANANPAARAAADWVSPLDNNQSAVANTLARLAMM